DWAIEFCVGERADCGAEWHGTSAKIAQHLDSRGLPVFLVRGFESVELCLGRLRGRPPMDSRLQPREQHAVAGRDLLPRQTDAGGLPRRGVIPLLLRESADEAGEPSVGFAEEGRELLCTPLASWFELDQQVADVKFQRVKA